MDALIVETNKITSWIRVWKKAKLSRAIVKSHNVQKNIVHAILTIKHVEKLVIVLIVKIVEQDHILNMNWPKKIILSSENP